MPVAESRWQPGRGRIRAACATPHGRPPRSGVSPARIRWAPRIDPRRLRRLYAAETRGLATAALIDDVGVALLLRCESILLVSAGGVRCPVCEPVRRTEFALRQPSAGTLPQEPQRCPQPGCGWSITWQQYHASWTKRRLFGGKAVAAFRTFAVAYPRTAEPRRKLLLIDQLLHSFHWDLEVGAPNRLAANNLIEGSHGQVLALLEELSGQQPPEERDRWRDDVARMVQRRRPRREPGMEPEPGGGAPHRGTTG